MKQEIERVGENLKFDRDSLKIPFHNKFRN